jgi:hypothetical protein
MQTVEIHISSEQPSGGNPSKIYMVGGTRAAMKWRLDEDHAMSAPISEATECMAEQFVDVRS